VVNLCRHFKINAEIALNFTNDKFKTRFRLMEDYMREDGKELGLATTEELENYWEKAKRNSG
jgi:uncharacterized protein YabN with tetrapyrrole methylase and pyrophosphatase domain